MNARLQVENLRMVAAGSANRVVETAPAILREALDLSGAVKPVVLTISTAEPTLDWHNEFIKITQRHFGDELGAEVINLHDFGQTPSAEEAADKIGRADTIWVAGGDTLRMIDTWQQTGIDVKLRQAANRGAVMSGGSAGMLAWVEQGHSDSLSYRVSEAEGDAWDYVFAPGLGYLAVTGCPHYDAKTGTAEMRETDFKKKFVTDTTLPGVAIGIANMAALAITDGSFKVIAAPDAEYPKAYVHVLTKTREGLEETTLPISSNYQPLEL